ncbi:MAG: hypothetical protein L6Q38_16260, partial [Nitrospira sp.]|nr:hypothetical protein [Nitrospira sp.]
LEDGFGCDGFDIGGATHPVGTEDAALRFHRDQTTRRRLSANGSSDLWVWQDWREHRFVSCSIPSLHGSA